MTVYFVRCSGTGYVKIGKANNPHKRLKQLQAANAHDLFLEAVMLGGYDLEQDLHARFASARIRGEWFDISKDIIRHVATVIPEPPAYPKAEIDGAMARHAIAEEVRTLAMSDPDYLTIVAAVRDGVRRLSNDLRRATSWEAEERSVKAAANLLARDVVGALKCGVTREISEEKVRVAKSTVEALNDEIKAIRATHAAALARWESLYGEHLGVLLEGAA